MTTTTEPAKARDFRMKDKTGRARMPWHGDNSHTKLSDGRVVLRGSRDEAIDRYGIHAQVEAVQAAVVATINTLGVELIGSGFTLITSSPIPDNEVANILVGFSAYDQ